MTDWAGAVALRVAAAAGAWYLCWRPTLWFLEVVLGLYPPDWFTSVVAVIPAVVLFGAGATIVKQVRGGLSSLPRSADVAGARESLDEAIQGVLDEDDFVSLWKESQERLHYYHAVALRQSRRSFAAGQFAALLGLAVVLVIGWFAVRAETATAAAAAAALGASAAALAGYIGATFVKTQVVATEQLRSYFSQASDSWRVLSSERLLDQIEDPATRDAAAAALVHDVATVVSSVETRAAHDK